MNPFYIMLYCIIALMIAAILTFFIKYVTNTGPQITFLKCINSECQSLDLEIILQDDYHEILTIRCLDCGEQFQLDYPKL